MMNAKKKALWAAIGAFGYNLLHTFVPIEVLTSIRDIILPFFN